MRFDYDTSYRDGKRLLRYPSQKLAYALLALVLLFQRQIVSGLTQGAVKG